MSILYPATFSKYGDRIRIKFRDVPEARSLAPTFDDAIPAAQGALATALRHYDADERPWPIPSPSRNGDVMVRPFNFEGAVR